MQRFSIKEIDEEEEDKTSVKGRILKSLHVLAVVASVVLALYWALFALDSFPLVVPADHDSEYVKAYTNAAQAGLIMSVVSIASIVIANGALARSCLGWGLSAFLIGCTVVASVGLYPSLYAMQLSAFRLPAQLAGIAVIVLGAVGFQVPWKKNKMTSPPPTPPSP